ncbi:hypothetical protein [Inquilinus sp.]|uniref:hypothetical protein n=1 Tax=Inquilinus sp. TaxID=1932117 RepID=UPI0031D5E0DE
MARVTNITRGPRFVYANGEPLLLERNETRDLPLRDAEIANVQHQVDAGVLAWDGEAPKAKADAGDGDKASPDLTVAQLLAQAESMNFMQFKSAASKVLGAPAQGKKEDIVAALQEKAKAGAGGAQG